MSISSPLLYRSEIVSSRHVAHLQFNYNSLTILSQLQAPSPQSTSIYHPPPSTAFTTATAVVGLNGGLLRHLYPPPPPSIIHRHCWAGRRSPPPFLSDTATVHHRRHCWAGRFCNCGRVSLQLWP